jgi:hypothetical protein
MLQDHILYLGPSPKINYFFKEPQFHFWQIVLENKIHVLVVFMASRTSMILGSVS